jgi:hypothetical protein
MERKYEIYLGTAVLALGIIILLFVFAQMLPVAQNPGEFVSDQVPGDGGISGGEDGVNVSFSPFVVSMVFAVAYTIMYLVGAAILKAGWNLITPKSETLSVRVKPKSLQVEPVVAPQQQYPQPQGYQQPVQAPQQAYQQPQQQQPYEQEPPPPRQYSGQGGQNQ